MTNAPPRDGAAGPEELRGAEDGGRPDALLHALERVVQRQRLELDRLRGELARTRQQRDREAALAAELAAVLDTVPVAVWISRDLRGDRIDANRPGLALLRRSPGENVSVTAPGEDRPRNFVVKRGGRVLEPDELPIQRAARRGEEVRDAELDLVFDDGDVRHVLGNATPLRGPGGEVTGSVGAFIDVTERRRVEEALREADRRKTEFLAVVSHELRNPLAPLRNSLELLARAPDGSDAARRAREVLHRQTDQLARVVDDLLDISRIAHGKIEVRLARVDARALVRRVALDARPLFEERGLALTVPCAGAPIWVDADAARLAQIVGNLLNNALKFTPAGGHVEVLVAPRAPGCELIVADTGAGIEPSQLERIFDPFVQAERTRGGRGGLGLGLALVRELAARHGGAVRAESAGVGRGARFVVQLPAAGGAGGDAPERRADPAADGVTVLLVDDDEDGAETLRELLGLDGHRVLTAPSGTAGLAALGAAPDILLCDVGLPDISGYDVIRAVRARPGGGEVFAVALTGHARPEDRAAALAAGFDDHVAKPPSVDELQRLLQDAWRRRRRPGGARDGAR